MPASMKTIPPAPFIQIDTTQWGTLQALSLPAMLVDYTQQISTISDFSLDTEYLNIND